MTSLCEICGYSGTQREIVTHECLDVLIARTRQGDPATEEELTSLRGAYRDMADELDRTLEKNRNLVRAIRLINTTLDLQARTADKIRHIIGANA